MVKLAWVLNKNSKAMSLKKKKLGLVKKVRELTILCDVRACLILFCPGEAEPMVWPSVEAARDLLYDFFALPEIKQRNKEMTLELYFKENIKKLKESLMKTCKKSMEYKIDQLMLQLQHGGRIVDLSSNEINDLLSFSKNQIMFCRKQLGLMQDPPLLDTGMGINDGLRQDPPPNGTTVDEDNDDVVSFDINEIWSEIDKDLSS